MFAVRLLSKHKHCNQRCNNASYLQQPPNGKHMNLTYFNPRYLNPEKLEVIINALHITEVYNFLPYDKQSLLHTPQETLTRRANESLDQVIKRGVYRFVDMMSRPVYYQEVWVDRMVFDRFSESRSKTYEQNTKLDDPNILILQLGKDEEEHTEIFVRFAWNILNKYGNIDYKKRIALAVLGRYITLEDDERHFSCRVKGFPVRRSDEVLKMICQYCEQYNPNLLAQHLLTEEGMQARQNAIDDFNAKIKEEESYADTGDNDWGQAAEMDYIRGNGGDWIDD